MELTPIKIRGKRRRKGGASVAALPTQLKAKVKRPKSQKTALYKPRASYLEKEFPLEILERIFWASENINLLQASPRLGRLLSGASTRRETFLQSFRPILDTWLEHELLYRENNEIRKQLPLDFPGNSTFQVCRARLVLVSGP